MDELSLQVTKQDDVGSIDGRLKLIIDNATRTTNNSWKALETETGIKAEKWRQFHRGSTKASGEMIEAVAKNWPDFAFWLACGDTEPERGHVAPPNVASSYPVVTGIAQSWATAERKYKQQLLQATPKSAGERAARDESLRAEVFRVREEHIMPAVQLCFERIMRALNEPPKDDLFLLEYDEELRKIRKMRWKIELKLQQTINTERDHLGESAQIEGLFQILSKIKSKFWKKNDAKKKP